MNVRTPAAEGRTLDGLGSYIDRDSGAEIHNY